MLGHRLTVAALALGLMALVDCSSPATTTPTGSAGADGALGGLSGGGGSAGIAGADGGPSEATPDNGNVDTAALDSSPEVANDGEADAVDDARSDAGYVRDVEIRDGEATDRALMACGPGFCNSDEICVKTQGIGGPYRPNDAGICDTGFSMLPGYPGFCATPATYECASLPGACASILSCACAENPICIGLSHGPAGSCESASGSSIWCLDLLL